MVGDKLTVILQVAPTITAPAQLSVSVKLALAAIVVMFSVAVPEFVIVIAGGWLVVPETSSPKVKVAVDNETLGAAPPMEPPTTAQKQTSTNDR